MVRPHQSAGGRVHGRVAQRAEGGASKETHAWEMDAVEGWVMVKKWGADSGDDREEEQQGIGVGGGACPTYRRVVGIEKLRGGCFGSVFVCVNWKTVEEEKKEHTQRDGGVVNINVGQKTMPSAAGSKKSCCRAETTTRGGTRKMRHECE